MVRIALAQINAVVGDLEGNKEKILKNIQQAKEKKADIVVFPELAISGYPPEDLLYKEHFVSDNIKILKSIIKSTKTIVAIVGFVNFDKQKNLYNAAAVISNNKLKGIYHKEELPNYGVFDEKRYFQKGINNKIFQICGLKTGINICEDIWIGKGPFKSQIKKGVKLIINISSSPYDIGKFIQRKNLLVKKAKESKTFIAYVNLVGGQDELVFDGNSMVIDPRGRITAIGKNFEEDLLFCDLNVNKKNTDYQPAKINQSLPDKTNQIENIYKALVLGTHDYVIKNGFKKVVVGLSGGIDSSLVAAIACKALGKENVIGVTMPSRFSSVGTRSDANNVAKNLGIKFIKIPIENIFNAYNKSLAKEFKGLKPDVAEENIQARIRGNLLMALSNKFGWLVLTTGNKSEVAVGYCTLYGDMSGGFAVIKDLPKTKVYILAKYINKSAFKDIIPKTVLTRPPTAELRKNQKDQDSLPEYRVLDSLLKDYVEDHKSLNKMIKGKRVDLVKKIIKLIDSSEYKRRQSPPGIKLTPRAFGRDWRLPITNKYKHI